MKVNSVYISFDELIKFGLNCNSIKKQISVNRESNIWQSIKDPNDRRKVLINLETIPDQTRNKYNLPTSEEYLQLKEAEAKQKEEAQKERENSYYYQCLSRAYTEDYLKYTSLYENELSETTTNRKLKVIQLAKEHAFWLEVIRLSGAGYRADKGSLLKLWLYYSAFKFRRPISDYKYFSRKSNEIRKALFINDTDEVVRLVASGNTLKESHPYKTDELHRALSFLYLSNPKRYSYRIVTELVNHQCREELKPEISESWIKSLMNNDNAFRNLVEEKRLGYKHYNDHNVPFLPRISSPYPGNLWMIDGTPIQFFCWNETRTKKIRLNLFVILDVCSRKIVGFDIALSEDRYTIMNALRMAVALNGHIPSEIISDNFSANKTDEIKELKDFMGTFGTIWRHSAVGNPQDKGQVERWIGTFQSEFCSLRDDYLGEGIQSRRTHGKRAPEHLESVMKKQGFHSYNEMKQVISSLIGMYNDTVRFGDSPNNIYKNLPKPNIKELNAWETSVMFWNVTSHTVKRGMVIITVKGQKYHYEIYDHDLKLRLQNHKVTVRYDETDLSNIMLFDYETDQFICECRQSLTAHIEKVEQTEKDVKSIMAHAAKKKSYKKHRENRANEILEKGLSKGTKSKEEYEALNPLQLDKYNRQSAETAEMLNYYNIHQAISQDDMIITPAELKKKLTENNKTVPFAGETV